MLNPAKNREIWLKDANEQRELLRARAKDIETFRKGNKKIKFEDQNGNALSGKRIKITQKKHDFKIGANIFMLDEFESADYNKTYRESFKKYFNLATLPFYWKDLEPEKGKTRYGKDSPKVYRRPAPDLCLEYCNESGIDAKLHCLIYGGWEPSWLPKNDMAELERLYEKRFCEIADRYSGKLVEFEVMNELLIRHGFKDASVINDKHDLIEYGFNLARKYFKNDTLVLNEAQPLMPTADLQYRSPYFLMIENALQKGAPIDKIGIQHHIFCGVRAADEQEYEDAVNAGTDMLNPERLFKGLDTFAEFGLPLELTEVTIPTFGETEEDEILQADLLELFYTVCFSHPAVDTLVYWNVPDGYAWVNPNSDRWNENRCRGGLWHHDLTPKKSAERLHYLFNEKWHTDLKAETDQNGEIEFRGFYGEYEAEIDGKTYSFGLHKNDEKEIKVTI